MRDEVGAEGGDRGEGGLDEVIVHSRGEPIVKHADREPNEETEPHLPQEKAGDPEYSHVVSTVLGHAGEGDDGAKNHDSGAIVEETLTLEQHTKPFGNPQFTEHRDDGDRVCGDDQRAEDQRPEQRQRRFGCRESEPCRDATNPCAEQHTGHREERDRLPVRKELGKLDVQGCFVKQGG